MAVKLPSKIVAIDIETTDSDYRIGDLAQIGAVIVNEDLSIGKKFSEYVQPLSSHRSRRAMEVNHIDEAILSSARHPAAVLGQFIAFARDAGERPVLASWGTYFDIVFLRETYHKLGLDYPFSRRCIDLKTIAIWEMAKRGKSMSGGVNKFLGALGMSFEGTPHDGLDDIVNTMRIIQKLGS